MCGKIWELANGEGRLFTPDSRITLHNSLAKQAEKLTECVCEVEEMRERERD